MADVFDVSDICNIVDICSMLSVAFSHCYAECHNAEARGAILYREGSNISLGRKRFAVYNTLAYSIINQFHKN